MTMPYCILHTEADSDVVLNGLGFSENDIHAARKRRLSTVWQILIFLRG